MMKDRSDEVRKIKSSISISELMPSISRFGLSNSSDKDIFPLDSFDSYRLMGIIFIRLMRPVPECLILSFLTALDPVRIN